MFEIGRRSVGGGSCFVIAEAGVNHDGRLDRALLLVAAAAAAGADAVKFQTFSATRLATSSAPKAEYQTAGTDPDESQVEMLRRLELSEDDHLALAAECAVRGIEFLSSPFDEESADLLERVGVAAFKVPSGELVNLRFLRDLAGRGRPLIVSTGMATSEEVRAAVAAIGGRVPIALLHCVSLYPAPIETSNLRAMAAMAGQFRVPVGWSDHTEGLSVGIAAVALGAKLIEKHLTLDRALAGPDHRASLDADGFRAFVGAIREVESSLGDGIKAPHTLEAATAAVARKSIVAAVDIPAGALITEAMLALKRPGTGLAPAELANVVGRRAVRSIAAESMISTDML